LVLIHIEKTAGCSIRKAMEGRYDVGLPQHMTIAEVQREGYVCPGYLWVAFVRNPYERIVSWYEMAQRDGCREEFNEFLDRMRGTIKPQVRFFEQDTPVNVKVGRFENLQIDFCKLVWNRSVDSIFDAPVLPVENATHHWKYQDYYDDQSIDICRHIVDPDCKSFGYTFQ
jgi:hypothetical protein